MPYLKFLSLVHAVRQLPSSPALDALEERLLSNIAVCWYEGKQVKVLEAMHTQQGVSPSTVHRRLKMLRKKGLIDLANDEIDNRIKYIVATPASKKYFASLERCLADAAK
ncbi:MAG: winged helix-turn-helix transcriptional regulator [Rhodoferax sp.]